MKLPPSEGSHRALDEAIRRPARDVRPERDSLDPYAADRADGRSLGYQPPKAKTAVAGGK